MNVVAYSGGLSSFMVAYLLILEGQPVECVFTDTKTEDEDLYRFLSDTERALGVPFHRIADGRNIWEVFESVKYHGNSRVDPCSRILKRELFKKWIQEKYTPEECVIHVGIGAAEAHRMKAIIRNWQPYQVKAILVDRYADVTREEILDTLDALNVEPPRLYEMGFPHNNCGGFCVKTGQKQMALLLKTQPEKYLWHEQQQERLFEKLGKRHGFIRKVIDGELKYLSLKEFRLMVEQDAQIDLYPEDGCGCFV